MLTRIRGTKLILMAVAFATACSEPASAPTRASEGPKVRLPSGPAYNYNVYGDEITLYDGEGGWVKLNTATYKVFNSEVATGVDLNPDQFREFLNEFTHTVAVDQASWAVDGLPDPCPPENPCAEPMSAPIEPIFVGEETSKPKKSKDGHIGMSFTLTSKKIKTSSSGAPLFTTMSWPPNCGASWMELRLAKDYYREVRYDVIRGLKRKLKEYVQSLPSGVIPNLSGEAAGEMFAQFIRQKEAGFLMAMNTAIYNFACSQFGYPAIAGPTQTIFSGAAIGGGAFRKEVVCVTTWGWLRLTDGSSVRAEFTNCEYVDMM